MTLFPFYLKSQVDAGFQPLDSDLTAIAALSTTSFGRSVLTQADAAAIRTLAGLGTIATHDTTDFQPIDSDLTAIAALTTTAFGRGLLAIVDPADITKVLRGDGTFGSVVTNTPGLAQGRLTLTTLTPVTITDAIGAGTIYYTPYLGDQITIYDGTNWKVFTFPEISISLSGKTSGNVFDLFAYISGGNVTLFIGPAWTSLTARGAGAGTTELTRQNGILVNANNLSGGPNAKLGRYLGSFYTISTGLTSDSLGGTTTQVGGARYLYNHYNRVPRSMMVIDTTDNWSYTTNTIRAANGTPFNSVSYLAGTAEVNLDVLIQGVVFLSNSSASAPQAGEVGVGIDSTTTFAGLVQGGYCSIGQGTGDPTITGGLYAPLFGGYSGYPGLGLHTINWNEKGGLGGGPSSSCTFLGDNGTDGQQAGMLAKVII